MKRDKDKMMDETHVDMLSTKLQEAEERAEKEGWIDAEDLEKELLT